MLPTLEAQAPSPPLSTLQAESDIFAPTDQNSEKQVRCLLVYSFLQQIFIEQLLYGRNWKEALAHPELSLVLD